MQWSGSTSACRASCLASALNLSSFMSYIDRKRSSADSVTDVKSVQEKRQQ